jgi:Protein of unknown function (DUF2802)
MPTFNEIVQSLTPWVYMVPIWVSGCVMALLFILWVWLRNRRHLQYLQMDLDCVRKDLRAMTSSALGMGGRVLKVEKQQRQIKQQPPVQAVRDSRDGGGRIASGTAIGDSRDGGGRIASGTAIEAIKPVAPPKANVVNFRPVVEDYAAHPYDYAIQLARHGASINDIMYQSGIGQNEAKLIHMLHTVGTAKAS